MGNKIYRSNYAFKRNDLTCWEIGRDLRQINPELASLAQNGELPLLVFKGGIERKIKKIKKYGSLNYLAEWQGLRGEDLNIDLSQEYEIICSKTRMRVIFTGDINKLKKA